MVTFKTIIFISTLWFSCSPRLLLFFTVLLVPLDSNHYKLVSYLQSQRPSLSPHAVSAPSWLAFQHFNFCSGISSIQGNLRDTKQFVLLLGGGCIFFTLVFSHSRVPVAADEGKLGRSVIWDEQRLEEEESWKRQTKMLAGSVGSGHELFPAVSTGTLLTVPFDGLTPSSPTRDRGSLPMNS